MFQRSSIGFELHGDDLRVAVMSQAWRSSGRRLVRHDAIAGFLSLVEDARRTALQALVRKLRLRPSSAFLVLPSAFGLIRQLEFPVEVGERAVAAAALQLEAISPWPADDVYWAATPVPAAVPGGRIRVSFGVVPRATLDPWIELFRSCGLPLTGISLASAAQAHGSVLLWGSRPTVVLSLRETAVEAEVVIRGALHVTQATADTHGEAARRAVERLIAMARVERPEELQVLIPDARMDDVPGDVTSLPVTGAAGASGLRAFGAVSSALLGFGRSGFELNLLPSEQRFRTNRLAYVPTALLALLVLGLLAVWAAGPVFWIRGYAAELDAEIARLSPQIREVAAQEAEIDRLDARVRVLSGHLRARDANLEALRELARILPAGTWINSYTCQDSSVSLTGLSDTAAQLQKLLEDSPVFRDAQFTATIAKDVSGKDRFSIRAAIEAAR